MSLRKSVSQLDWHTSSSKADFRTHWRLHVVAALGAVVAICVFRLFYPNTLWFLVLWCGLATGSAVGLIPGTLWQLASRDRVSTTSGRFILTAALGWGAFSLVALLVLGPMLKAQETGRTAFRAFAAERVVAIEARGRCAKARLTDDSKIRELLRRVATSELFYPSHEGAASEMTLSFILPNGKAVEYPAEVPERHLDDISVTVGAGEMLVQGARSLLGIEARCERTSCCGSAH